MEDQIILVNEQDEEIGYCGKQEAHERALLHRAFSVFIFRKCLLDNPDGTRTFHTQLLIQKRAAGKYHSAGLWANSCCSHPRKGEKIEEAAHRRLKEETGLVSQLAEEETGHVSQLEEVGAFTYRADFDNGLTEREFDHVFVGWIDKDVKNKDGEDKGEGEAFQPNPEEAEEMCYIDVEKVMKDLLLNPAKYAPWFMPALMIATDGQEFDSLNKESSRRIIY